MMNRVSALGIAALVLVFAAAPTGATAAYSYQGSDFSYDSNSRSALNTCDKEADGVDVKGEADNTYGSRYSVVDGNGSSSGCGFGGSMGQIVRHHTCEIKWGPYPNDCGAWTNL